MSLTPAFRHKKTKHLRRGSMRLASAMIYAAAIVLPGATEASASDDASGMTSVIQVLKDHRFQALDPTMSQARKPIVKAESRTSSCCAVSRHLMSEVFLWIRTSISGMRSIRNRMRPISLVVCT
jgi:hypothetical protein